jgi:hypothetical protein
MATHPVLLVGGPCDGQTKTLNDTEWNAGETTCQGAVYVFDGVNRQPQHLDHFTYRPGAPKPPPPEGGGLSAPRAHHGWSDLQRTMNRKWPKALNASERLTRAALRSVSKARKVRL